MKNQWGPRVVRSDSQNATNVQLVIAPRDRLLHSALELCHTPVNHRNIPKTGRDTDIPKLIGSGTRKLKTGRMLRLAQDVDDERPPSGERRQRATL